MNITCQNGEIFKDLGRAYKATDLEYQVNKTRFYEENQCDLHRTLSPARAKSLHDESMVAPGMSLHRQQLSSANVAQSGVPQSVCNHHCRDTIRRDGERIACSR